MIDFIRTGGYIMIPLMVIAVVIVFLTVRMVLRLLEQPARRNPVVESGIDAVAFWGGFGVIIGVLGTLVGIGQAASAIQIAGDVSAGLAWGGIEMALHSTIFGLALFSVALLLWFGLRTWYRRRIAIAT